MVLCGAEPEHANRKFSGGFENEFAEEKRARGEGRHALLTLLWEP